MMNMTNEHNKTGEGNAPRIVATNDYLDELERVTAQRDELLAALKSIAGFVNRVIDEGGMSLLSAYYVAEEYEKPLSKAEAAIAKVEGSAHNWHLDADGVEVAKGQGQE